MKIILLLLLVLACGRAVGQTKTDSTPLSSMRYVPIVVPGDTSRVLFYENGNIVVKGDTIAIIKYLATQMFYEKAKAQAANKQIDLIEERRRKKIKQ